MNENKKLNRYVNEIIAIGTEAGMGWREGINMFLANVENFDKPDAPYYPGADLDWPEVRKELGKLTDEDRAALINSFMDDYRAHKNEIIALRAAGKYDEVVRVMEKV